MSVFVKGLLYSCLFILCIVESIRASECGARCSRVLAPVCALVAVGSARDVRVYHNICHLNKIRCLLKKKFIVTVVQLPDYTCGIRKRPEKIMKGRRYIDNSIIGSRGMCNHTCPTHCTDIYDPVCVQFWDRNKKRRPNQILVNHCHADLLSCTFQLTAMVVTLDYCFGTMTQFAYSAMAQAAVLKKMGLITV